MRFCEVTSRLQEIFENPIEIAKEYFWSIKHEERLSRYQI